MHLIILRRKVRRLAQVSLFVSFRVLIPAVAAGIHYNWQQFLSRFVYAIA